MTAVKEIGSGTRRRLASWFGASVVLLLPLACVWSADANNSPASASVPDISGPWLLMGSIHALRDAQGHVPVLTEQGRAAYEHNRTHPEADPLNRCLPLGMPRVLLQKGFPFNIVQGASMYAFMFEWNHLNRIVYMNRSHFDGIGPQYFGQSVGHWDGDTLVVESNAYNDATYLDDSGLPHSDQLTTVERLQLAQDGSLLRDRVTITDPETFTHPWTAVLNFRKAPGAIVQEDYCLGRVGLGTLKQAAPSAGK